jgi:hypothetical protein
MSQNELSKEETFKYAQMSMTWYGWGSPVGLSIAILSVGAFLLCLKYAGLLG